MSSQESIESRVIQVIAKAQRIPVESVTEDSTFEQLLIDSLDGLEILFALEEEFKIDIPDEEGRKIKSIREAADGVRMLIAKRQDAAPAQA